MKNSEVISKLDMDILPKIKRVLIIDDEPICRRLVFENIKSICSQIDVVATGAQALTMMRIYQYDLVISDIGLPDFDGLRIMDYLRQEPRFENTIFIAMTAYVDDMFSDLFNNLSELDYILFKPVSAKKLKSIINKKVSYLLAKETQ